MQGVGTLISSVADDAVIDRIITHHGGKPAGEDRPGKRRFSIAGMTWTVLKFVQAQDEFSKLSLSTTNFFRARVDTRFEGTRTKVLEILMKSDAFVGVATDGSDLTDPQFDLLLSVCGELGGLLLLPPGLFDSEGRLVLGVDGESEVGE